jgi:hypothetical protein
MSLMRRELILGTPKRFMSKLQAQRCIKLTYLQLQKKIGLLGKDHHLIGNLNLSHFRQLISEEAGPMVVRTQALKLVGVIKRIPLPKLSCHCCLNLAGILLQLRPGLILIALYLKRAFWKKFHALRIKRVRMEGRYLHIKDDVLVAQLNHLL